MKGSRAVPITEFYLLPGKTPQRETVLEPGDLITHVTLPAPAQSARSVYLKLRDRSSYEFALASAAIVLGTTSNGVVNFARVAMGGVGAIPWRSQEAERVLTGKPTSSANFLAAANAALHDAKPQSENAFKVDLAKRCLVHALKQTAQVA
jgi:xanthine dehydrogenase YagS FAD-binding subunit